MGCLSLKSGVFFSRFDGGVVFRGAETPVVLRGKRAHDLVKLLVDRMETCVSRNDLLAQFPDPLRQVAAQLLSDLEGQNLLRDRDADDPPAELTLQKQFRNLWNFLADRSQRPGEALLRWRATQFYIVGPLRAGLYVARSLAECAALRIALVVPEDEAVSRSAVEELCARFPDVSIEVTPNTECEQQGTADSTWIQACGDREFTACEPGLEGAWYFGLLAGHLVNAFIEGRLADALPRWQAVMHPALGNGQSGRVSEQRMALGAAALAFAIFGRNNAIENDPVWASPRIITLEARIVPVAPATPVAVQPAIEVADSQNESAPTPQPIDPDSEAIRALFDPITGILEEDDADIIQVPLSIVQLKVYAQDRSASPTVVQGWGMNHQEARLRAIQRGVLEHLQSVSQLAEGAAGPAVAWSKQEALENALALAEVARETAANAKAHWETAAVQWPETLKLFKLLELLLAARPQVEIARTAAGHAVRGRVSLDGEVLAEECAGRLDLALHETLGQACMRVQLAESSSSVAQELRLRPGPVGADGEASDRIRWIDVGFPSLATHLFAAVASPGAC